ncbi:MAG: formylglycine-generating enzyme family protein [Candidatus Contendobacter sp.]|nr:formylglycine-generating enzyme family protein [Candidatus Contendobacter sp.]MDG4558040.1 formylglycine-generating enzyme family protein [Candidatus Contendobacter sp.]
MTRPDTDRQHVGRTDVGRADLIRLYAKLEDETRFQRVAEAMGYRKELDDIEVLSDTVIVRDHIDGIVTSKPVAGGVRHRHYRLVERRALAPPPPPSPVKLPPPDEEEPVAPLGPSPPLIPWPRLWPFLRAALGEYAERHRIDLRRVVAVVARRRPLRRLPRLKGLHWAPQGQLILDLHPRLYPFWGDFNALKTALPRLRGATGLDILCMTQGPAGPVQRWEGKSWGADQPYVPPPPGTPVLIAGDLGCLGTDEQWRPWESLGRRLTAQGIFPVALTPCPARWWNPALAGLFFPVVLDRAARLPPRPAGPRPWPAWAANVGEEAGRDAGAKLLLTLLSACIGITPALLRHLRHALPVERADVGSEAAAWLHPAFRPGDFALLPGDIRAVESLREAFGGLDPDARRLAWNLIRAQQREVSLAVRMEERALYAAMEGRTDPEVEIFMDRVAAALQQAREQSGNEAELTRFLSAWANRCGRRMHPAGWNHSPRFEALWVLANPKAVDEGGELPAGFDIHRALAALDRPEQPQNWHLIQRGERFEIEAAARAERAYASGSPIADFSTRRPMMQARERRPGAVDASLPLADGVGLPVNETGYRLKTDGDELVIESFSRPVWAHTLGRDGKGLFAAFSIRGVTQRVRWIWPGRFLMGSPEEEHDRFSNELQHEVILTRGFWLAETACTQALWQAAMGKNPSGFKGQQRPVETVSWDDAQDFIARLNGAVPGLEARLPTEAEWEYACRAGTTTPFSFGEDITPEQVNYGGSYPYRGNQKGQYRGKTVEVASLPANPWGLYEMHGNVWEWCQDWYGAYHAESAVDPPGPETGEWRVLRGGSWFDFGRNARSASRIHGGPGDRSDDFGFRLALGPELRQDERAGQGQGGVGQTAREAPGGREKRGRAGPAARK